VRNERSRGGFEAGEMAAGVWYVIFNLQDTNDDARPRTHDTSWFVPAIAPHLSLLLSPLSWKNTAMKRTISFPVISMLTLLGLVLIAPRARAQDLFVASTGSSTIKRITPGGVVSTYFDLSPFVTRGLVFDSTGNLFISYGFNTIGKITPGGVLSTQDIGVNPFGFAMDSADNLYTANKTLGTISKITPGGVVSTFASGLNVPRSLAFDSQGNLYAASHSDGTISKITPGGVVSTFATGLNTPRGLAFDSQGNLFATNFGNNQISKITPGGLVSAFITGGTIDGPQGLAIDASDNLYVGNQNTGTISKITSGGTVSTFATGMFGPWGLTFKPAVTAPEPGTLALLALGVIGGVVARRRRK
jgi:hypothetical protein